MIYIITDEQLAVFSMSGAASDSIDWLETVGKPIKPLVLCGEYKFGRISGDDTCDNTLNIDPQFFCKDGEPVTKCHHSEAKA